MMTISAISADWAETGESCRAGAVTGGGTGRLEAVAESAVEPEEGIAGVARDEVSGTDVVTVADPDGVASVLASPVGSGVVGSGVGDADRSGSPSDSVGPGDEVSANADESDATPAAEATTTRTSSAANQAHRTAGRIRAARRKWPDDRG